jgi:lipopolysaccharide export system permease protein
VFRISIIDRYITREIFYIFAAIVLILVLVLVAGSLVKLLQLAAEGTISHEVVFNLLGLEILRLAGRLVPPAFFFATLFVLGRMYRDNEMTVLATSGIGVLRLFRLVMVLALPVALVTAWLTVTLYPSISYLTNRIKLEQQDAVLVAAMDAGRFIESNRGDIVLYAGAKGDDKASLKNLFVQHREDGKVAIVTAVSGHHAPDEATGLRTVTLEDGMRYEGEFGDLAFNVLEFGEYRMWVNPVNTEALKQRYNVWSAGALIRDGSLDASAELQKRLSFPLSLIAFALLAVPLSRSMPRQGIHGRVVLSILIYLIFAGLTQVAGTWMQKGVTPEWMGTWWVVACMVAVGLFLLGRELTVNYRWVTRRRVSR